MNPKSLQELMSILFNDALASPDLEAFMNKAIPTIYKIISISKIVECYDCYGYGEKNIIDPATNTYKKIICSACKGKGMKTQL